MKDEEYRLKIYNYLDSFDLDTIDILYIDKIRSLNKWSKKSHSHNFIEMLYFDEGRANIDIYNKITTLSLYEFIFYPPNIVHNEYPDSYCSPDIICLQINTDNPFTLNEFIKVNDSDKIFKLLFEQVYSEIATLKEFNRSIAVNYIKNILLLTKRYFKNYEPNVVNMIEKCILYINDYYKEDINIKKLSDIFYVSPSYLSRTFKEKTGTSPIHYLNMARIEEAKKLLQDEKIFIKEISELTGFHDPLNFSRYFKKYYGCSPEEYRKNVNNKI